MSELNFQEIMEVRNQTNAFARSIGLGLTFLEEGHAVTEMDITENQLNPIGSVHGGCLYTAADVAAGGAAISFGDVVTTVDSSFRYLRPGLNTTRIKADAVAVKHGKRLTVIQVNVFNQNDTLLCIGTFSFMSVDV
ncbi:MAG: PaaI family thioesterase [Lachnospiraceae bacterium]|nr:PaaI family thioesterase [Lachnospiraceae bacterium]